MKKELRRSSSDVKLCGVCGGIAEYVGVDSNLVRLIWVAGTILSSIVGGIIVYIIAVVLMPKPEKSSVGKKDTEEKNTEESKAESE